MNIIRTNQTQATHTFLYKNLMKNTMAPASSLKMWFIIHFIVDYIFGIPLLLAPQWTLTLFGFQAAELLTPRLVGAALLGIGGISLIARNESKEVYRSLLLLKILWSVSVIIAIILTLIEGAPTSSWIILMIFIFFSGLWCHYLRK